MAFTFSSKILLLALSCFTTKHADISFSEAKNQLINQYHTHNAEQELGVKSANFEVSENGFIRYKKTYSNHRTEYYSAKLTQFKEISYLGNETAGWLVLRFTDDAIIYQTYNDKDGNVDEMLTQMKIPMKNIDLMEINKLEQNMITLKNTSL